MSLSPPAQEFIAGGVSGCAAILVGQPLDTVRIMQQANAGAFSSAPPPSSVLATARGLIARGGGVRALWRGVVYPATTIAGQVRVCEALQKESKKKKKKKKKIFFARPDTSPTIPHSLNAIRLFHFFFLVRPRLPGLWCGLPEPGGVLQRRDQRWRSELDPNPKHATTADPVRAPLPARHLPSRRRRGCRPGGHHCPRRRPQAAGPAE